MLPVAVVVAAVLLAGCTGSTAPVTPVPDSGSAPVPASSLRSTALRSTAPGSTAPGSTAPGSTAPTTAPSFTPVTDSGLVTGPGVDDASISLGVIVDPGTDRGFTAGLQVWRESVNSGGGICGRTIELVSGTAGLSDDQAYREVGRRTLGLILLPQNRSRVSLGDAVRHDRIPAVTPEGRLSDLTAGTGSPVVLGATDDVIAINTAAAWLAGGTLTVDDTLAVLIDGDPAGSDAVTGLSWWAARTGVTLAVLGPDDPIPAGVPAIYAATSPVAVGDLLRRTTSAVDRGYPGASSGAAGSETAPSTDATGSSRTASSTGGTPSTGTASAAGTATTIGGPGYSAPSGPLVATTIDGYLPQDIPVDQAARLQIATVTPAYGAPHPVASAVQEAFTQSTATPGIRSLEGYATGNAWARLLEPMCTARTLTRSAAAALLASAGPAAPDSLFGPTLPANQVTSGLPASRVSALSVADPTSPTGLRPVSLLESAPAIGQYRKGP